MTSRNPIDTDKREVELTILMPCLNEALTLEACIRKAQMFLERCDVRGEIVISDNGSTDGSQALARKAGARVVNVPTRGYGAALIAGIAAARGTYVIMGDSDDSYDFSRLDAFLIELRKGTQLVMGNRFLGGIEKGAMPPLHRWLGNPVLTWIGRTLFERRINDYHCGLRGFSREAMASLGLCCTGMEFASEMVVKSSLRGLSIAEVPTKLAQDGRDRPPHLRSWRDGWRHLRFLLLFSPNWLFLFPGLLLFVLGILGELVLLPGPIPYHGAGLLGVHTMLFCAGATIIGLQLMCFAVMAQVFASEQGILPMSKPVRLFREAFSIEVGLIVGLSMLIGGLALSVSAWVAWDHRQFGTFDPEYGMRMVIPAVTLLVLAVQVMFATMFIGVLGLREHGNPSPHLRSANALPDAFEAEAIPSSRGSA